MNTYAQIDTETGRVVGVSHLAGPLEAPHMIPITEGQDVLGMVWDGTQFIAGPPEPIDTELVLRVAEQTAQRILVAREIEPSITDLPKDEALSIAPLFPEWAPGQTYKMNQALRHGGGLLRVLQAHTSQADWLPENTPALYTVRYMPEEIPDWTMPQGGHDAPNIGDKRRHNGLCWSSKIDGNTTVPGSDPRWWDEFTCP